MAQMEYYSFERVLKELQIEEDELKRLVSEGEIRAFRDDDKMKFKKSDIEGLKKGRMTEPTIILPSGEGGESSEDSEVLLVEEDTSETLLDIEELESAESSSASVPTVDFSSSSELESSPSSGTITEELTFEDDSGSYVLESSDDVLIDSSQDLVPVESSASSDASTSGEETFIDGDTGLQTEPLQVDDSSADYPSLESADDGLIQQEEDEGLVTKPGTKRSAVEPSYVQQPVLVTAPVSPMLVVILIFTSMVLLYSGFVMIHTLQEIDTPITGSLTDTVFGNAPSKYGAEKRLEKHLKWRNSKRTTPGRTDRETAEYYLNLK